MAPRRPGRGAGRGGAISLNAPRSARLCLRAALATRARGRGRATEHTRDGGGVGVGVWGAGVCVVGCGGRGRRGEAERRRVFSGLGGGEGKFCPALPTTPRA